MRIIHTADWHIGQTLRGHAREHEHRAVLKALADIAAEREADALIVAGDVFDHHNPSGEAQRVFYNALVQLRRARPSMTIVITAGNHDAAGRLEAPQELLAAMGVHVVGNVRRRDGRIDATRHLVALPLGRRGEIAAHVLAVSHPTAACLPALERVMEDGASPVAASVRALYAELAEASMPRTAGLPLLVTGHLHVAGAIQSEGAERRILVGGQDAVPPDVFPPAAAYVALGHLHRPQWIGGDRVRYSGSLLPLSATEIGYRHGVTLLSLGSDGMIAAEHVELPRPVSFVRVPEKGECRLDELSDHLAALAVPPDVPIEMRPFVIVRIARDGLPAGWRAQVEEIAERYPVRLVDYRQGEAEARPRAIETEPHVRLAELEPEEMFVRAFQHAHAGAAPTPAHLKAFRIAAAAAAAEGG